MVDQELYQFISSALLALGALVIKHLWDSLVAQKKENSLIHARISNVELLVAKEYVEREEFRRHTDRVINKLDTIEAKLNEKADK